jgi:hypothetical protein
VSKAQAERNKGGKGGGSARADIGAQPLSLLIQRGLVIGVCYEQKGPRRRQRSQSLSPPSKPTVSMSFHRPSLFPERLEVVLAEIKDDLGWMEARRTR